MIGTIRIAQCCLVSGRVQGVFYRASTQQMARSLGIAGHAKNLADGRVEVLAVADPSTVARLVEWLWQGPPAAQVTNVEVVDVDIADLGELPTQFITR